MIKRIFRLISLREWRWPDTFASLRYRNYRLWFLGQAVSLMGTWMQSVAQGWLVYEMTKSEFALGAISFIGTIPSLFLMLPAGVLADRVPRRQLLIATQATMMLLAFIMAALAGTGTLQVWHVGVLAALLGVANSFDSPARLSLAVEMVDDRRDLSNAIALNSTMFNLARVVGPAVGGIILAALGATWCFALNGLSFLAVIWGLFQMRLPEIVQASQKEPISTQLVAGIKYTVGSESVRALMALLGGAVLFGMSFNVLLPAYAESVLHVGETGLGIMNAAVGAGALLGSLIVASMGRAHREMALLCLGCLLFPGALVLFGLTTSFSLSLIFLALSGFALMIQNANINTLIQITVPDQLRGRVMGVYSLVFFGLAPFGSLLAGSLAQNLGPGLGVTVSASVNLAIALVFLLNCLSSRRKSRGQADGSK